MLHYLFLTFDSPGHVAGIINLADKLLRIHPEIKCTVYIKCSFEGKWGTTDVSDEPVSGLNVVKLAVQPDGEHCSAPFDYSLRNPKEIGDILAKAIEEDINSRPGLPQKWDTLDLLCKQCNLAQLHNGMLINDQEETYNQDYISAIKEYLGNVWFIGYLPPINIKVSSCNNNENNSLYQWLDLQKRRSVIYIALGTEAIFCKADRVELAFALEKVGCPVVWSLKKLKKNISYRPIHAARDYKERETSTPCDEYGLPEGWRERMGSRVILLEWAPQICILGHPSTGLFISHCGWNSLSECISVAGIPIIGVPMLADQPMNGDMMENKLKIGKNLWKNPAEGELHRNTTAALISEAMKDEELIKNAVNLKRLNDERFNMIKRLHVVKITLIK
ncbi:glycosyltransferase family 1 protein [Backusella circina FSU 941]|nr:glycosyltransferase family 1 protein [Backusella circina FSU 941]